MKLVRQLDEKDCSAACLCMILRHYGRRVPLSVIHEQIGIDHSGGSMLGLMTACKKNGMICEGLMGTAEELYEAIRDGQISFPFIAYVLNRNGFVHNVVVNNLDKKGRFRVLDPDLGSLTITREDFEVIYHGCIMTLEPGSDFVKEDLSKDTVLRFAGLLKGHSKTIAIIFVTSLVITALGIGTSFLSQFLIDNVLGPVALYEMDSNSAIRTLGLILIACAAVYAIKSLIEVARSYLIAKMSSEIDLSLMTQCFSHLEKLKARFFDTRSNGEIISRLEDTEKIRDALSSVTVSALIDIMLIGTSGVFLFHLNKMLFLLAAGLFAAYSIMVVIFVPMIKRFNQKLMNSAMKCTSYMQEAVSGMMTAKISGTNGLENVLRKFISVYHDLVSRGISGAVLSVVRESAINLVSAIGSLLLLWFGARSILDGSITLGELMTFNSLLAIALSPIESIVGLQGTIQSALVAAERLSDILDQSAEKSEGVCPDRIRSIDFKNISFRYGCKQQVLTDFSMDIKPGERVALVGPSGCGKSTVTKLAMGLYAPESGNVLIAGSAMETINLTHMRDHIACVSQDVHFFSDTIRNNLLFGNPRKPLPSDEEIMSVLSSCCCDFALDAGLDAVLEANAENLSGGQRQRLALVRAILRDPDFLILDEATSALDTETEKQIVKAIFELCPNTTILTVAHRISTIAGYDKILVMNDGHVEASGTHQELLGHSPLYKNLCANQGILVAA